MSKYLTDLLFTSFIIAIFITIWSGLSSFISSAIVIVILFVFLFTQSIYLLIKRDPKVLFQKLYYTFAFYGFASIIFMGLLIDDLGVMTGIYFLAVQVFIGAVLSWFQIKSNWLNKYPEKSQNIIIFSITVLIFVINLLTII